MTKTYEGAATVKITVEAESEWEARSIIGQRLQALDNLGSAIKTWDYDSAGVGEVREEN